jgi:hypothetical protein
MYVKIYLKTHYHHQLKGILSKCRDFFLVWLNEKVKIMYNV